MSQTVTHDAKLTVRRVAAVLLLILIIPTTVTAFWLYNANRVIFDPNTYKSSLNNRAVYDDLFGALMGGFTGGNSLPRHADALLPLIASSEGAETILFPSDYAQKQIDTAIDQLNDWLNGKIELPDVSINLAPLKDKLTGSSAPQVISDLLKNLPTCRPAEEDQIKTFGDNDSFDKLPNPLCAPKDPTVSAGLQKQLTTGIGLFSAVLPDSWKLSDELNAIQPIVPNNTAGSNGRSGRPTQIDVSSLATTRVDIWLQARLMVLLFLVPIALMCLIVIVIVRSTKTFFRWLSWALILSGFVSLIPVLIIALSGISGKANTVRLFNTTTAIGELAINSLARGAVQAIVSTLILGVLIQVAILIVVGLFAAFISILLTAPEPLLSDADLEALIAVQSGATPPPTPLASNGR